MNFLTLLTFFLTGAFALAADKPNILWITSEDNSIHWLGCYGNKEAQTPRIDALAANGIQFNYAYSNSPVCAVARSTILNGAYAVTQGTQHMRSRHPIPAIYKPYVSYLKEAGYYCTNNAKTDYNFKGNDNAIWDESSNKAHYNKRPEGKPFFSIFNLTVSHESSLFADKIKNNRNSNRIPKEPRINPTDVTVPPYLPDLPEIRSDIAIYHDTITALDQQIGKILDNLKNDGLADDTIVFYYSDHGGILPRGKRYLTDTGVRVPMIVHVPEKWAHLSPFEAGKSTDETVAFVDLAPTLLSLVGMEKPSQMQGRAFLGKHRTEPQHDDYEFLTADRFDEIYGMRRGITDGPWKYIRRFTPHRPAAPYSYYQFGQAGWRAYEEAWKEGTLDELHEELWNTPQVVECLYHVAEDPWEINNLANDAEHAERLNRMRKKLKSMMVKLGDTSIVPEPMFEELAKDQTIHDYWRSRQADHASLVDLAFLATGATSMDLPLLLAKIDSEDPITRYWATMGCVILGKSASPAKAALEQRLNDSSPTIRAKAAFALFRIGDDQQKKAIIAELDKDGSDAAILDMLNILLQIGGVDEIPDDWVNRTLNNQSKGSYLHRCASRIKSEKSKRN